MNIYMKICLECCQLINRGSDQGFKINNKKSKNSQYYRAPKC